MARRRLVTMLLCVAVLAGVAAGSASPAGTGVLVCGTHPSDDGPVKEKLQETGLFAVVDYLNCGTTTPTLAQLRAYAAVLVYPDYNFQNRSLLSDNLADFVDGGGRLVATTWSYSGGSWGLLEGRLFTGGYLPFAPGGWTYGSPLTLVPDDASSPLLAGVTSFVTGANRAHDINTLAAGATLVAHWSNGVPLVAFKGSVVGLNFYPPSETGPEGVRLLTNALLFGVESSVSARAGYCSVAGNTDASGKAVQPGTFLDLALGQPDSDAHYKGALPASYLEGRGISCDVLPGYVKAGAKVGYGGSGHPGIYEYYRKA